MHIKYFLIIQHFTIVYTNLMYQHFNNNYLLINKYSYEQQQQQRINGGIVYI